MDGLLSTMKVADFIIELTACAVEYSEARNRLSEADKLLKSKREGFQNATKKVCESIERQTFETDR